MSEGKDLVQRSGQRSGRNPEVNLRVLSLGKGSAEALFSVRKEEPGHDPWSPFCLEAVGPVLAKGGGAPVWKPWQKAAPSVHLCPCSYFCGLLPVAQPGKLGATSLHLVPKPKSLDFTFLYHLILLPFCCLQGLRHLWSSSSSADPHSVCVSHVSCSSRSAWLCDAFRALVY